VVFGERVGLLVAGENVLPERFEGQVYGSDVEESSDIDGRVVGVRRKCEREEPQDILVQLRMEGPGGDVDGVSEVRLISEPLHLIFGTHGRYSVRVL